MYRVGTDVRKTVESLVNDGADINAQNNDGLTPLHVARGKEAIKACLRHASDQSFTITDKRGRNFWHLLFIFQKSATNIHPTPFASGATYSSDDLNRTPLHYACMNRNEWITGWRWLAKKVIQEFSDSHVNQQDSFGRTALHYAAMTGETSRKIFLRTEKAADDTIRDNFRKTADEYSDIFNHFAANFSRVRSMDTSSLVMRNVHSLSLYIQQCFSHQCRNVKRSAELHKIIIKLRADNTTSYVVNVYKACRLDYTDATYSKRTALEEHRREELPADVSENATHLPTMYAAIQSEVEKAMQHLAKEISARDSRFACEVFPVGSAHEGTKIGCCDEFDYNFVLTDLSRRCEVCYSPESPPGFVLLKASTPAYDGDLFDSSGTLNTRIVKFKFKTLVKQILSSLSFCEATGFEFIDHLQGYLVPPGNTSVKVNTQVELVFTKPVNGCHVPHNISVDVVPALHIDG